MRILDLFSGAGGAAMGYSRAGFSVVGVDVAPQPRYPFEFIQTDALHYWFEDGMYDAVHASPPCQTYIRGGNAAKDGRHKDLLEATRTLLEQTGLPYVIENVPGAPMLPDVVLCGSMFGLAIRRHRWFETNWSGPLMTLACDHSKPITGVYGNPHGAAGAWKGMLPSTHEVWSRELGIDWMTSSELALAIPPAYTEFIGIALLEHLRTGAAA